MDKREEQLLAQYEAELNAQAQQQPGGYPYSSMMMSQGNKQNLIEYELDFRPELDDIRRMLRCDILVRDKDGNEYWVENPDKTRVFMNDLGVNDVIRNIIILVNKNKALAYYTVEEVENRVRQIKHEIRTLIYNNYESYGVDNDYKMNNYSMMVISIGSVIEDVYRRAVNGETHKGLTEQRIVQQSEQINQQPNYPVVINNQVQGKKKSWLNPFSWGKN